MSSRRQFIKTGAAAGAATLIPWMGMMRGAYAFSQSPNLVKFIQPMRGVGGAGIPIAAPDAVVQPWWQPGVTHYTIDIGDYADQLHPQLPNPTRLRGYGQAGTFRHLGGVIAAKRGTPVQITFRNNLSGNGIIPIDTTIPGANLGPNRVATHLHGGFVPWISDGGPESWWDPSGNMGRSFTPSPLNPTFANPIRNPAALPNEQEVYYPNNQGARMMWYHDHAIGITRTNAYAGLASAYVLYDDYETILLGGAPYNLPGPLDPRTTYLVFQDKVFVSPSVVATDPTWPIVMPSSRPGDLWYAHVYEPARWVVGPPPTLPLPDPSSIPEFFGDTMLVNGTAYPTLHVQPRQYRWRMLNACNARFLNPRLVYAQGINGVAATEPSPNVAGPAFVQIGTEGGFLPAPAMLNGPKQPVLLMAPAERTDLIVDFRAVAPGSVLILYNDAPAPFPKGSPLNDYYPQNPKTPTSLPGLGPNTRTLLQIVVDPLVGPADPAITLPATLGNPLDPFIVVQTPGVPTPIPAGVPVRRLTLNEAFDAYGRLIQMLGTDVAPVPPVGKATPAFGRAYDALPLTENVAAGSTEVWEIVNLTADTHPMHFHLVNVQVLSRQAFSVKQYAGGIPNYQGQLIAPDANELGWRETVRMNPGQVTRVIMRFDLPAVPFAVPASPHTAGNEYVWHCHILEHEEHDMMRPLVVR